MSPAYAGSPSEIVSAWADTLEPGWREAPQDARTKPGAAVRVPCGSCSLCCRSAMRIPLTEEEAARFPHDVSESGRAQLRHRGRDCELYDAELGRCSVYETRPQACREYDCRALWLAGLRSTERGREINERLDTWRTQFKTERDYAIAAAVWLTARAMLMEDPGADVGLVAGAAAVLAALQSDAELRELAQEARSAGFSNLAVLNGESAVYEKAAP